MKKLAPRAPFDHRWILAGLFFFINPNVASLDVLPDAVGAVLIVLGFLHLAEIDERAKSAQKSFIILSFVSAARLLTLALPDKVSGSAWSLIFTFTFGIGESILFVYALWKLYDGLVYQAMRRDCAEVYTGFTVFKPLTLLVALLKGLLCFLPELTGLSTDYGEIEAFAGSRAQIASFLHTALIILNIAVVTLYGIGWWIYMLRFFRTAGKNEEFSKDTEAVYFEEIGSKPEVLTYRALKGSALLFGAGFFLLIPLRLDGIDYLPDFAAGILLLFALLRMRRVSGKKVRPAALTGALYTLAAAAEWIYGLIFFRTIPVGDGSALYGDAPTYLLSHPEKLTGYYLLVAIGIAKYLALAVFLIFICRLFPPIIRDHTGVPFELSGEHVQKENAAVKKKLTTGVYLLIALSALAAASGIFFTTVRMFSGSMLVEYSEIVFVIALLAAFMVFLARLQEAIDNKYYMVKD